MGKTAILKVKIVTDARQAKKGAEEAASGLDKIERAAGKAAPAALAAGAGLIALGVQAGESASRLQQSTGAVEAVFGNQAHVIEEYAKNASKTMGLATAEYEESASIIGAQLKNMGVAQSEVAGQTDELMRLGADLAATFGGTTAEAVGALSALLRGERDPIERYGVAIKEADINAKLAAMGLADLEGEAGKAARTQATLALLTEQTAGAQGQFAREIDSAAGSAQIAAAQWEDAKATLGESLLPVMSAVTDKAADLAETIKEHPQIFRAAAVAIGIVSAAIVALTFATKAYAAIQVAVKIATAAATAAQWAMNLALTANPIGLVIVAIGAVIAALVALYYKSETFRWLVGVIWDFLKGFWAGLKQGFWNAVEWIQTIINYVSTLWDWIKSIWNAGMPSWVTAIGGWFSGANGTGITVTHTAPRAPAPFILTSHPPLTPSEAAPTYQITVNGALDPLAVAEQIRGLLRGHDIAMGGAV